MQEDIILNECQQIGFDKIQSFLKSDDKLFFTLSGSAGTGKTTLCRTALKGFRGIAVTAPTHKAKKVIQKITGYQSSTIHSLLGLRPDMSLEDFSQKNTLFAESKSCKIAEYKIIVIDESSMLNADLVALIKRKAKEFDVKILFMGDKNQLPPVKEVISKVFTDPEIETFELSKVERQKEGNPLLMLYSKILSNIGSSKDMYEKEGDMQSGIGYHFIFNPEIAKGIIKWAFLEDAENSKVICWTNDKVGKWNKVIRAEINKESGILIPGEIIMGYRTVTFPGDFKRVIVENSCDYKVISVNPNTERYKYYKEEFIFFGQSVKILSLDSDFGDTEDIFVLDEQSYKDFYYIENNMSDWAKGRKDANERKSAWARFYEFRNRFFLLGDIRTSDGKLLVSKDIDYAYAITVHKSQGSTYKNVFCDELDMDANFNDFERNRLKYVAFSRPTDGCYIYNRKK